MKYVAIFLIALSGRFLLTESSIPVIINTWAFTNATAKAWSVLTSPGTTAIDAVVAGCDQCETDQCDGTVGFGGSPDESGETTLDSLVLDGNTMSMGSVGGLRRIKNAVRTAESVMKHTEHSVLVGELATQFAKQMGFKEKSLSTKKSKEMWKSWKANKCQPNFWQSVTPDPQSQCGPYKISETRDSGADSYTKRSHDTISMAAIDTTGRIAVATSSNGAKYKIPGRMGDASIAGAGAYADSTVGAALATGDGDVMMRFLPSFLIVERMRSGSSPQDAVDEAIRRIAHYFPKFSGALIGINKEGEYAAACHGISEFPFSVFTSDAPTVQLKYVQCLNNSKVEL